MPNFQTLTLGPPPSTTEILVSILKWIVKNIILKYKIEKYIKSIFSFDGLLAAVQWNDLDNKMKFAFLGNKILRNFEPIMSNHVVDRYLVYRSWLSLVLGWVLIPALCRYYLYRFVSRGDDFKRFQVIHVDLDNNL